ncbi:MAG: hypothetical protein ABEH78_05510, partial [Haloferacaceae archaeon]
ESVRRVQFRRKRTFDAGATPGLDDVERPDLKSVSDDLVDELRDISAEREARESELADLRTEIEEKEARIRELERELEQARDLERMADRFSQALLRRAEAPYRRPDGESDDGTGTGAGAGTDADGDRDADADGSSVDERSPLADAEPWPDPLADGPADGGGEESPSAAAGGGEEDDRNGADDPLPSVVFPENGEDDERDRGGPSEAAPDRERTGDETGAPETTAGGDTATDAVAEPAAGTDGTTDTDATAEAGRTADRTPDGHRPRSAVGTRDRTRESLVADLTERIESLDDVSRGMLRYYRAEGPAEPVAAHLDAGGDADREVAYSRNRTLRTAGLVSHAERGTYDYALPELVREEGGDRLRDPDLDEAVREIEASFVERAADGGAGDEADDPPVDEAETADVEFVGGGDGGGDAAFREDDAEFVDDADPADAGRTGEGDARGANEERGAGTGGADDPADGDEAVVMEETASPSDGMVDRGEEPRDAEFVE